jgi:hypothetical protein
MADQSPGLPEASLSLTFVVSPEPAFLLTAEALVARAGEHAGCGDEAARRLGQAVRQALGGLIAHPPAEGTPGDLEVAFCGNGRLVRVDVGCTCATNGSLSIEDALTGHGDAATLRRLVDRVEFVKEGQRQVCRLTQQVRSGR